MNKGITLISLIITIILMVIIGGSTAIIGVNMIEKTQQQDLNRQLAMVNNAILERYTSYIKTKDVTFLLGSPCNLEDVENLANKIEVDLIEIPNSYECEAELRKYYKLSITNLDAIGIEKSKYTYIVNYLTGEVINETKALEGERYYMYSKSNFNLKNNVTAF